MQIRKQVKINKGTSIVYNIFRGREEGPRVWLTACMHGDESDTTSMVHTIQKRLPKGLYPLLKGILYVAPIMNPSGHKWRTREVKEGQDLNRSFPGNPRGNRAEIIAHAMLEEIVSTKPDLVVDIHSDWPYTVPYAILDKQPQNIDDTFYQKTREHCTSTGLLVVREADVIPGTLSLISLQNRISSMTLEFGMHDSDYNEGHPNNSTRAVFNLLGSLGMIEWNHTEIDYPTSDHKSILRYGHTLTYADLAADEYGTICYIKSQGQKVKLREELAVINDSYGRKISSVVFQRNRFGREAIILGHKQNRRVFEGERVVALGVIPRINEIKI